jgi:hypothetical protein
MEYITQYPETKIYIALYAEGDTPTEETNAKIQVMRDMIGKRKAAHQRFRKNEIQQADNEGNQEVLDKIIISKEKKLKTLHDPFLIDESAVVEEDPQNKLIVDDRGRVMRAREHVPSKEDEAEGTYHDFRKRDQKYDDKYSSNDRKPAYNRDDNRGRPSYGRDDNRGRSSYNRDDNSARPNYSGRQDFAGRKDYTSRAGPTGGAEGKPEQSRPKLFIKARTYRVSGVDLSSTKKKVHLKF